MSEAWQGKATGRSQLSRCFRQARRGTERAPDIVVVLQIILPNPHKKQNHILSLVNHFLQTIIKIKFEVEF